MNCRDTQNPSPERDTKDIYRLANNQIKDISEIYMSSCRDWDNISTCEMLDAKLTCFSDTVFGNGKSIYYEQLQKQLSERDKDIKESNSQININMDINSTVGSISCSPSRKFSCVSSEEIFCSEFEDLFEFFKQNNSKKTSDYCQTDQTPRSSGIFNANINWDENVVSNISKVNKNEITHTNKGGFKTAAEELQLQNVKKHGNSGMNTANNAAQKKKLGVRRNVRSKFVSPLLSTNSSNEDIGNEDIIPTVHEDERLKNIDPKMVELIKSEIMDCGPNIHWNDIAGLEFAKSAIQEAVVWPMLRPDIFKGLRRPPKGILLFGPPGTGKTLIGKCVASQSKSTFFSISASSLTSKWIGDGEKMVRALFSVARVHQPAVIFIDEIDSLLSQRSDTEHESSRRIKTEFLVQLDGATTDNEERILVIGATNRPQELDEAARRRFVKRLYIPLPELQARLQLIQQLISNEKHNLKAEDFKTIATLSDGYSGADIRNLCSEASLGPIRSIDMNMIEKIEASEVRPLLMEDFEKALNRVKSSVSISDLDQYVKWHSTYGSGCGL